MFRNRILLATKGPEPEVLELKTDAPFTVTANELAIMPLDDEVLRLPIVECSHILENRLGGSTILVQLVTKPDDLVLARLSVFGSLSR